MSDRFSTFICYYYSSSIKFFLELYQHLNRVKWNVLFEDLQFEFGLLCLIKHERAESIFVIWCDENDPDTEDKD